MIQNLIFLAYYSLPLIYIFIIVNHTILKVFDSFTINFHDLKYIYYFHFPFILIYILIIRYVHFFFQFHFLNFYIHL